MNNETKITVRLDSELHRLAKVAAKCRRQSLNSFILLAIDEQISRDWDEIEEAQHIAQVLDQNERDELAGLEQLEDARQSGHFNE